MCKLLDIQKTHTTTYHPQSDGMVERFNRTLTTMLSAFVNEHHSDWDVHLPFIMMAYRSSVHDTTGMTQNMMMFGREVATPLDLQYEMPSQIKESPSTKWVWELQERLENAHAFVRKKMNQSMVRQKHYHDRKLKWKQFEDGEEAYVFFPRRKPEAISNVTECESCKRKRPMVDVAVQTDRSQKTVITRRVKRFREGDIDIEEVREEKIES